MVSRAETSGDKFMGGKACGSFVRPVAVGLAMFSAACAAGPSSEIAKSAQLKAEIVSFLAEAKYLSDPGSPFLPYLSVDPEDGLTVTQRYILGRSEDEGSCLAVQRLWHLGLQKLHPELQPLFEDDDLRGHLLDAFYHPVTPRLRRCLAVAAQARYVKTLSTPAPPVTFPLDPDILWDIHGERPDPAWDDYQTGFHTLGELAFCEEYVPAILDLLGPGTVPDRLELEKADELYLRFRLPQIAEERFGIYYHVPQGYSSERTGLLQNSVSEEKLVAIHGAALGEDLRGLENSYWAAECARLEELGL